MELVKEVPAVVPTERPLRKQSSGLFSGRGPPGESNSVSFKTIRILHLLVIDLVLFFIYHNNLSPDRFYTCRGFSFHFNYI